eukprot:INCI13419.8.p2 GENE.INCI13419.8~~INCI13419.8.p2  ORF type:complete len:132 (+),score=1.11 INCI13419.8:302-697(+)
MLVRLAWHCSGSYDAASGTGGSNGATMRFKPESDHGGNAGLGHARALLEPIKAKSVTLHLLVQLPSPPALPTCQPACLPAFPACLPRSLVLVPWCPQRRSDRCNTLACSRHHSFTQQRARHLTAIFAAAIL